VKEPRRTLDALRAEDLSQLAETQLTDNILEKIDRKMQDDQGASTLLSFEMFGSM